MSWRLCFKMEDFKIRILNKIFNSDKTGERVNKYINDLYVDSPENKKLRKSFHRKLMSIISEEHEILRSNIALYYNKEKFRSKRKKRYSPTDYVMFCREMKEKHPSLVLNGKMQLLWKARREKREEDFQSILKKDLSEQEVKDMEQREEYAKNAARFELGNID